LILGNISGAQAILLTVGTMVEMLPKNSVWTIGGIVKSQLLANTIRFIAGDEVQVGLEDNVWYDEDRIRLASNRKLIERILGIASDLGRKPFSEKETCRMLGL
jgi:uncharacterized protein (DUF849 family)